MRDNDLPVSGDMHTHTRTYLCVRFQDPQPCVCVGGGVDMTVADNSTLHQWTALFFVDSQRRPLRLGLGGEVRRPPETSATSVGNSKNGDVLRGRMRRQARVQQQEELDTGVRGQGHEMEGEDEDDEEENVGRSALVTRMSRKPRSSTGRVSKSVCLCCLRTLAVCVCVCVQGIHS